MLPLPLRIWLQCQEREKLALGELLVARHRAIGSCSVKLKNMLRNINTDDVNFSRRRPSVATQHRNLGAPDAVGASTPSITHPFIRVSP